jgi:hypothetical protein
MSIFSGILNTVSGGLIGSIGDTVKQFVTTDADRLAAQQAIEKQVQDYTLQLANQLQSVEQELTDRQKNDMASDSWLSKNVRPLTMVFLTLSVVVLAYLSIFALDAGKVALLSPWIDTLKDLLQTVFVFYFGSRGFEKITKMVGGALLQNKK